MSDREDIEPDALKHTRSWRDHSWRDKIVGKARQLGKSVKEHSDWKDDGDFRANGDDIDDFLAANKSPAPPASPPGTSDSRWAGLVDAAAAHQPPRTTSTSQPLVAPDDRPRERRRLVKEYRGREDGVGRRSNEEDVASFLAPGRPGASLDVPWPHDDPASRGSATPTPEHTPRGGSPSPQSTSKFLSKAKGLGKSIREHRHRKHEEDPRAAEGDVSSFLAGRPPGGDDVLQGWVSASDVPPAKQKIPAPQPPPSSNAPLPYQYDPQRPSSRDRSYSTPHPQQMTPTPRAGHPYPDPRHLPMTTSIERPLYPPPTPQTTSAPDVLLPFRERVSEAPPRPQPHHVHAAPSHPPQPRPPDLPYPDDSSLSRPLDAPFANIPPPFAQRHQRPLSPHYDVPAAHYTSPPRPAAGHTRPPPALKPIAIHLRPRRKGKGLRVHFVETEPEVIGEGGDESETPVYRVQSEWKASERQLVQSGTQGTGPGVVKEVPPREDLPPMLQAGGGPEGGPPTVQTGNRPPSLRRKPVSVELRKRKSMDVEEGAVLAKKSSNEDPAGNYF